MLPVRDTKPSSIHSLFHQAARSLVPLSRKVGLWSKRVNGASLALNFFCASSLFAATTSFHAEWNPYEHGQDNFTLHIGTAAEQKAPIATAPSDQYFTDFEADTEVRQYASVSADMPNGTQSHSADLPFIHLDGAVISTLPKTMHVLNLSATAQNYVLRDTKGSYIVNIIDAPPATGYISFDNGTNRYYKDGFEEVYSNAARDTLLIRSKHDFSGKATALNKFYFHTDWLILGYCRNVEDSSATTVDDFGVQQPVAGVVIVHHKKNGELRRILLNQDRKRIRSNADAFATQLDAVDRTLTYNPRTFLDPNGSIHFYRQDATGRKARILKWDGTHTKLPTVEYNLDNVVIGGKSFGSVDPNLKLLGYARQLNGSHLLVASRPDSVFVVYTLDANGNMTTTADGSAIKKNTIGPLAGGNAMPRKITPGVTDSDFSLVLEYVNAYGKAPKGTWSVWNMSLTGQSLGYFWILPEANDYNTVAKRVWLKPGTKLYGDLGKDAIAYNRSTQEKGARIKTTLDWSLLAKRSFPVPHMRLEEPVRENLVALSPETHTQIRRPHL